MKVEVRNLGVIKNAEIDLKPLTIFIGPNNAGKTWLAYTLSGIFGYSGWTRYGRSYIEEKVQDAYPPIDTAIEQVLNEGNTKIDLVQFADVCGEKYINNLAHYSRYWLREYMSTDRVSFENLEVHISLAETKKDFLERILSSSIGRGLAVSQRTRKPLLNALKERGKPELYIYTSTEGSISEKLPHTAIKEILVMSAFEVLSRGFYPERYTFPTERSALITNPFNRRDQRIRPLIGPVDDFLTLVNTAFLMGSLDREERDENAKNDPAISNYIHLAQLLEKQILGGGVDFSTPEPDSRREILFKPKEDISMEIPIASSMVKELSSLVLYLRYLAKPGEWLIIDEPEMNLHPKAQAQLTEFLAMLVNAGLPILITTHSPYIVDHLSNLMKATKSIDQETIKNEFYLQRTEAFIPQEQVSVYLVDEGTSKNILDEDGLVRWGTFGDVSDRVSEIYFKL